MVLSGRNDHAVTTAAQALVALDPGSQVYLVSSRAPTREVMQARPDTSPTSLVDLIVHSPYEVLILPRGMVARIEPAILDRALDAAAGQVLIVN